MSSRRQWALVGVVACGAFITALDQTVVVTALPAVMADLKVPIIRLESVIWVVTAYLLGYTVAMPLLGRLADVHGYVRIYWASLAVFGIGTTLVALSGESEWLNGLLEPLDQIVVARVIQAIGGGGAVPISLAIAAAWRRRSNGGWRWASWPARLRRAACWGRPTAARSSRSGAGGPSSG